MSFAFFYSCLCFFCLLPLTMGAQKNESITTGTSLTAGDESSWVSLSGDFAFGFQLVGTGGYLVAVWFNKIPQKTIIWSANRDGLAQLGSTLQLSASGRLVLYDPSGSEMWSAPASGAAYGTLRDTGNLELIDGNSNMIWQSFDFPTDTILPTQLMKQPTYLVARISDTNYSSGRFMIQMQPDGNFVFYKMRSKEERYISAYDASGTFGTDFQVVFNKSGSIYLTAQDGSTQAVVLQDHTDPAVYYQRLILEFDGVLRKYVYPRSSNTPVNWTMANLRPQNICNGVTSGGEVCGFNSICHIGDDQVQRTICECPPGYIFLDQTDRMKGCKPNFTQQTCFEDPQENDDQFHFEEMHNTIFPDYLPYEVLYGTPEVFCRHSCLSDCYCAAVVFQDVTCKKMRFPLSNGWINQSGATIPKHALIKVGIGNSASTVPDQHNPNKKTEHKTLILVGLVFLGSSVFLLLTSAVFALTFCTYKRKPKAREYQDIAGTNMRNFNYKELEEATKEFKEVVGQGAFATVYKGLLDSEEGNVIAVKKLNEKIKDNQREFESEVKAIARTGHRNLVRLIGFCNEEQHRLLVYEFMPNGSLAENLLQAQKPNLDRRIKFALETAKGLNYLHEECSIQIIHCDIKLQNVLLDDSFTSRISDFGLAKLLKKDQAHTMTGIRGTKGYVAPEWFKSVPVTTKVDVYSYGILLLELICCRRCFEPEKEDESQMILADWAYDCYNEGRIDKLVEGDNEALADTQRIKRLVMVALWCIQEEPVLRPSMNKVVQMIKEELEESLS